MLNIKTTGTKKSMTIILEGKLDTVTAQSLEEIIKKNIDDLEDLTFDMTSLKYISSAGLRILLTTQKTMNSQGSMKVVRPNEVVREIFEDTGFYNILTIEE